MKKTFKQGILGLALAGISLGTVVATPITYTFNASGSPLASYAQLDAGSNETVTVTAASSNGASQVTLNGNPGLGVRQVQGGGSNTVDANGSRAESLLFSFDEIFKLVSFSLTNAGPAESFILTWGSGAQTLGSESLIPIGSTSVSPYLVQSNAAGDWFRISATQDGSTASTFYVQSLSIDGAQTTRSNVPEPASSLLLALGLGGMALRLRRR